MVQRKEKWKKVKGVQHLLERGHNTIGWEWQGMSAVSLSCVQQIFLIVILCGSLVVFWCSTTIQRVPTTSDGYRTSSLEVSWRIFWTQAQWYGGFCWLYMACPYVHWGRMFACMLTTSQATLRSPVALQSCDVPLSFAHATTLRPQQLRHSRWRQWQQLSLLRKRGAHAMPPGPLPHMSQGQLIYTHMIHWQRHRQWGWGGKEGGGCEL